MQHRNAPLTPNGRLRMVLLVEEQGMTFEAAAAASNVAKSTAWTWVQRWRRASTKDAIGVLAWSTARRQIASQDALQACSERVFELRGASSWGRLDRTEGSFPHARSPRAAPARLSIPSRRPARRRAL